MTNERANHNRLWLIDFVRQASITLVLLSHLSLSPFTKDTNVNWCLIGNGKNAVALFFLISGFVIARTVAARNGSLDRIRISNFYIMRIARIVPLIALVCLVGAILSALPNAQIGGISWTLGHTNVLFWVTMLTFTFNWLLALNHQQYALYWDIFWSLSMEEQFYFFGPWIAKISRSETTLVRVLIAVLILAPLARIAGEYLRLASPTFSTFYAIDLMALGVLLHLTMQKFGPLLQEKKLLSSVLCVSGFCCVVSVLAAHERGIDYRIMAPSAIGIGLYTFLLGGLCLTAIQKLPRFLVAGGELSYGAYLWHPLMLGLVAGCTKHLTFPLAAIVFVAATLAFAAVSYVLFEKPANTFIRKTLLKDKKDEPNPIPHTVPSNDATTVH